MTILLFICPGTGTKVQHRIESENVVPNQYEAVICPACSRLHFLNRQTGKLLGHENEKLAS
jgi:hypothetical protein